MRVGLLSPRDPESRHASAHFHMARALHARLGGLERVRIRPGGTAEHRPLAASPVARRLRRLRRLAGDGGWTRLDPEWSALDAVVAPNGSTLVGGVPDRMPLVYASDATFELIREGYADARGLDPVVAAARDEAERHALARADRIVHGSRWASDSAARAYGADPDRLHVVLSGANLDAAPDWPRLEGRRRRRLRRGPRPASLVFLGRDWTRKGGDVAVAAVRSLRARGIDVRLEVIGGMPPEPPPRDAAIRLHGLLDLDRPGHRRRLHRALADASLLLLPTRADCTPRAIAEGFAYGLPVVCPVLGGIPSMVRDGIHGRLLAPDAGPEAYADAVAGLLADPDALARMAGACRLEHDARQNWGCWADAIAELLEELVPAGGTLAAGARRSRRVVPRTAAAIAPAITPAACSATPSGP